MKYFKMSEFDSPDLKGSGENMDEELLSILDCLRFFVEEPIIVNSGFRTPEHNKSVGGEDDSSHLKGLAVDIKCSGSILRHKIISEAMKLGIKRIGIAKTFIHLDVDKTKPQRVIWLY